MYIVQDEMPLDIILEKKIKTSNANIPRLNKKYKKITTKKLRKTSNESKRSKNEVMIPTFQTGMKYAMIK